jgi:hypothetical protein
VDDAREAATLLAWMRDRSLTRLALLSPPLAKRAPPRDPSELERAAPSFQVQTIWIVLTAPDLDGRAAEILATRPDAVHLPIPRRDLYGMRRALKKIGFEGPVFASTESARGNLFVLEDHLVVLAPLRTAPPSEFLSRHAHPFAYAGYRGTLRYLDALDADPKADPMTVARTFPRSSGFDSLQVEPKVYQVRAARFHPVPPK